MVGIHNGVAIGSSMGFSPQSGLPQNNCVGDPDSMAIPYVSKMLGLSVEDAEHQLTKESGLQVSPALAMTYVTSQRRLKMVTLMQSWLSMYS